MPLVKAIIQKLINAYQDDKVIPAPYAGNPNTVVTINNNLIIEIIRRFTIDGPIQYDGIVRPIESHALYMPTTVTDSQGS